MKAHFDVVCPTLIARKKELDTGDKTGKIGYVQRVSCVVGRKTGFQIGASTERVSFYCFVFWKSYLTVAAIRSYAFHYTDIVAIPRNRCSRFT